MNAVNLKEARKRLGDLVRAATRGESVVITRRGRKVACLVPVGQESPHPFPDLAAFRSTIRVKGRSLSRTVLDLRRGERY